MPFVPSASPIAHITDPTTGNKATVSNEQLNVTIYDEGGYPASIDDSTHTIQTIAYEHHEIHSGSHFFVAGVQDLAANEVLDFTWQMPNTTEWIHWSWSIECESETTWYVYEGADETNPLANSIYPINSNRNSGHPSATTMKWELQASLAAANADTDVTAAALLETGIVGSGRRSLGNTSRQNEIILKQGTLYCLRALANSAGYINFNLQWYEHTDKVTVVETTTTTSSTTSTTTTGP